MKMFPKTKMAAAAATLMVAAAVGTAGAKMVPFRFMPYSLQTLRTRLNPFDLTVSPVRASPVFAASAAVPAAFISFAPRVVVRANPVVSPMQPPDRSPLVPPRPAFTPFRPLPPAFAPKPAPPRAAPVF